MSNATLHESMSRRYYTELPGMNWSILKHAIEHPAKAVHQMQNPTPPTPRMVLGSAIHSCVLEGESAMKRCYTATPSGIDRRTKAGKAAYAEFEIASRGKQILSASDYETTMQGSEAVRAHPGANDLLSGGEPEQIISFDLCEGLVGKCILDWLPDGDGPLVDLKTTRDASPSGFSRQIANYKYAGQACFYRRAVAALRGEPKRDFVIVAVETEAPYLVGCYRLNPDAIDSGERMVDTAIARWLAAARQPGFAPHYTDYIEDLGIPPWAMHNETANVVA